MSYLVTLVALTAAGLALLDLLRLRVGRAIPDLALGWLVGAGWLAAAATPLRFALGVPFGRPALAAIVLAPIVAWAALRRRRRAASAADTTARWLPRPAWLFAPLAAYVVVVVAAVLLHGTNTPTQTDDGVRVRAFAPMLAFGDRWDPAALGVFGQAAPLATFVPATAWVVTGTIDHFHVNYVVLTELVALLALLVGVASARGAPERGWASAFAVLSIPLFVYHCTSTYSDAILAARVAGGVLFVLEYARSRERADLARAFLLLGLAALVKREGELVAAAPACVLLAQVGWERWRERRAIPWGAVALLVAPGLLAAVGKIGALGLAGAFPMLRFVAGQAAVAAGAGGGAAARPDGLVAEAAQRFFGLALFRSGNQGMLYWAWLAVIAARARAILRGEQTWALLAVAALLAENALSAIVIIPEFTLDQGTVNRALLVASVPISVWVATTVVDGVQAESLAADTGAAPGALRGAAAGDGDRATRRRPRARRASRR